MQLPPEGSSYTRYVIYGRYVARRLRRARKTTLADTASKAAQQVKTLGRAEEDAAEPVQDAAIIPTETVTDSVLDLLKSVDPDLFSIF